ncbi:MAG: hypothetical protein QXJ96_01760 [Candidatus Aenigmatarchaeota archaeon]|nr:hypothetical protein [Candidatus Aenigmarchaeota archaeon]
MFKIFKQKFKGKEERKEREKIEVNEEMKKRASEFQRFFEIYHFNNEEERKNAYNDFSELLLLNPELIKHSSEEIAKRAEDYAKNNIDLIIVQAEYRFASGIALLEGNVDALVNYLTRFNEIRERRGNERMFDWTIKNPVRAVEVAKAFYEWKKSNRGVK